MKKNPLLTVLVWFLLACGLLALVWIGPMTFIKSWLASMGNDEVKKKQAEDGIALLAKSAEAPAAK